MRALQWLNQLGYGREPHLRLDLVYNPAVPRSSEFSLTPNQTQLEQDYRAHLQTHFGIVFNQLYTLTNLPIGRIKQHLVAQDLYLPYLQFLATHHNPATVANLMCRNQLSVDYMGNLYDCDFNQMEGCPRACPVVNPPRWRTCWPPTPSTSWMRCKPGPIAMAARRAVALAAEAH